MKTTIVAIGLLLIGAFTTVSANETIVRCDTLQRGDSIMVITTACAPICSSVVQVYNTGGKYLGQMMPPYDKAVFPEAYIEEGQLRWRDNTEAILDENEKR